MVQRYCSYLLRKPLFHLVSVYVVKELVSRGPAPMRNRRQTVTYRKCGAREEKKRDVRIMEHILNMLCVSQIFTTFSFINDYDLWPQLARCEMMIWIQTNVQNVPLVSACLCNLCFYSETSRIVSLFKE